MRTTIAFEVELNMFCQGAIRIVRVPKHEIGNVSYIEDLNAIWYWGQNDHQPQRIPSISMGDVIRLRGERYLILAAGYRRLKEGEITVGLIPPTKEKK
jgi:hypothetical protein